MNLLTEVFLPTRTVKVPFTDRMGGDSFARIQSTTAWTMIFSRQNPDSCFVKAIIFSPFSYNSFSPPIQSADAGSHSHSGKSKTLAIKQ